VTLKVRRLIVLVNAASPAARLFVGDFCGRRLCAAVVWTETEVYCLAVVCALKNLLYIF